MITNPVPTIHYSGILQVHPSVHCTPGDNTVRLGPDNYMTMEQLDQFILTLQHARHWASTGTAPTPSLPTATSLDDLTDAVTVLSVADLEKLKAGAVVRDSVKDLWVKIDNNDWTTMPSYEERGTDIRHPVETTAMHRLWSPLTRASDYDVNDIDTVPED